MNKIQVCAVQFPLQDNVSHAQFLQKVEHFIDQCLDCDLIVFPELYSTEIIVPNEHISYHNQLRDHALKFTPEYIVWLQNQAQSKKINILGGTVPRVENHKIYNTAILALSSGEILYQDKLYLTPDEKSWNLTPGSCLNTFETPMGKIVINICFDSEIPEISNLLVSEPPEIILIPSWTSTLSGFNRVEWSARARAVEHYAYVIKTGTVSGNIETEPFSQASIISPQETGFPTDIIHGPQNRSAMVKGELDLSLLHSMRKKSGYYPSLEQTQRPKHIKLKRKII